MNKSESVAELAKALARAQSEMKEAELDSVNTFFKKADGSFHKYASLHSVWKACREALNKNGLSILQGGGNSSFGPSLITRMLHSSGEYIDFEQPLFPQANEPQKLVAAITYARRCALASIAGVVDAEDTDGNDTQHKSDFHNSDPSEYILPPVIKKYAGQRLGDISKDDIRGYYAAVAGGMKQKGQKPYGAMAEAFAAMESYIQ